MNTVDAPRGAVSMGGPSDMARDRRGIEKNVKMTSKPKLWNSW